MPPIKSKTASIHLKNKEPVISERPNGSFNNAAEDAPRILNNCFYLPDKEEGGADNISLFKNKDYFNLFSQDGARAPERGGQKGAKQERLADLKVHLIERRTRT